MNNWLSVLKYRVEGTPPNNRPLTASYRIARHFAIGLTRYLNRR